MYVGDHPALVHIVMEEYGHVINRYMFICQLLPKRSDLVLHRRVWANDMLRIVLFCRVMSYKLPKDSRQGRIVRLSEHVEQASDRVDFEKHSTDVPALMDVTRQGRIVRLSEHIEQASDRVHLEEYSTDVSALKDLEGGSNEMCTDDSEPTSAFQGLSFEY
jgi:hypothetical protein